MQRRNPYVSDDRIIMSVVVVVIVIVIIIILRYNNNNNNNTHARFRRVKCLKRVPASLAQIQEIIVVVLTK